MKGTSRRGDAAADTTLNEMIARAKKELEHMIDVNPQTMLLLDARGHVLRANRALLDLLGLPDFSSVLGKSLQDVFCVDAPMFFDNLLGDLDSVRESQTNVRLAGGLSHILCYRVLSSGTGELTVLIVENVTAERIEAATLEKQHKREAVEALVGALMHHLNQPLTVISVRSRLLMLALEKPELDVEELKQGLADIMDHSLRVGELLRRAEKPKDYVTQPYVEGLDILDLERCT